jgi:hypothetical protein
MAVNGEAIYATHPWIRFKNERGREVRYTQSDKALYAIVIGDVAASFTIEQPGIPFDSVAVLGAHVLDSQDKDGMLTLFIDKPIASPAVVVRFNLP